MNDVPSPLGSSKTWMRLVGMGTELAAFTLLMTGIGYWIDSHRHHTTAYCTAVGALIGFVLGMIRFILQAMKSVDAKAAGTADEQETSDLPKRGPT